MSSPYEIVAALLKQQQEEIQRLKRRLDDLDSEREVGANEPEMFAAPGTPLFGGVSGPLIQYVSIVKSVNSDGKSVYVQRARPSTDTSTPWMDDEELTSLLTVRVPAAVNAPAEGDTILVTFTGVNSDGALYGVFGAGGGGGTTQYKLKEQFGDYYRCRTWDGTTEGTTDYYVAKPYYLRRTPFDGQTIGDLTYSYTDDDYRTVTAFGKSALQVVVPYFNTDDIIYAAELSSGVATSTTAGSPVTLVDMNADGRYWLRET